MRALLFSTRIRVGYKGTVKEWVELSVDGVVDETVAHGRLVDVTRLRVADLERVVRAVTIFARKKIVMERKNVVHQVVLELLHVFLLAFASHEFLPCAEQIFNRNDIVVCMSELNPPNRTPPQRLLPLLERIKSSYILWHEYHSKLPKVHQYTVGAKIDLLFVEVMEMVSAAAFLPKHEKLPYLRIAIRKFDTIKLLLLVLWESKSLDTKKYAALSLPCDEIGKMLGGWQGQLIKNSTPTRG
ncbi:MAG TPA: four helix bundle protein [Candidatus Paceibacterota bacterium]